MEITFRNKSFTVVVDGNDVTLQSVSQNITFYGAYQELKKLAERAYEGMFPGEPMPADFLAEFVDNRVEKYLNSIAIMGEITNHPNN